MAANLQDQQRNQLRLAAQKALGASIVAILLVVMFAFGSQAEDETRFLRIGTGSPGGTYFPIGNVIAEALSGPLEDEDCAGQEPCGIPGLMAVARASFGAVENLANIRSGLVETGFVQSDLAYWATHGQALYAEDGPMTEFRAIASLYPEVLHIVVPADSEIESPKDLRGKRVSLGPKGSGTLIDAQLVLEIYGLDQGDVRARHLTFEGAAESLKAGDIDAFFAIGGVPIPAIANLAEVYPIRVLALEDWAITELTDGHAFFSREPVDMASYGLAEIDAVAVQALWLTTERVPDDIVYEITRALWQDSTRQALAEAHPTGARMAEAGSAQCLAIPLHRGAKRYYREVGGLCTNARRDDQVTN